VRRIVGDLLGIDSRDLDVRRPIRRLGPSVDDLDFVEIIMAIEERCSVSIDDAEAEALSTGATIEQLAHIVDRKVH
jgi:acyl carrier protein